MSALLCVSLPVTVPPQPECLLCPLPPIYIYLCPNAAAAAAGTAFIAKQVALALSSALNFESELNVHVQPTTCT